MDKMKKTHWPAWKRVLLYYVMPVSLVAIFLVQPSIASRSGRIIASNIFLLEILALLAAMAISLAGRWMKELEFGPAQRRGIGAIVLVLAVAGALFFFLFYSGEREIKVYDFSAYWIRVLESREMAAGSLVELFKGVFASLNGDYNYVAALPLVPVSYLFGTQYLGYVLSIFLVYYIPSCFFIVLFAMRLVRAARSKGPSAVTFAICFVLCTACPGFLWPLMNGYVDVSGVLIMALMMNITIRWNGDAFSWRHVLSLSALSLLLVLLRRWYAYFIVAFYVALAVDLFLSMARARAFSMKKLGHFVLNMGAIVLICSLAILLLNRHVFTMLLGTDYAVAYSMAKVMLWYQNLWELLQNWGLLLFCAALIGLFMCLKSAETRFLSIRMLVIAALSFGLFTLVQNLDMHHFYLVTPVMLCFVFVFCDAAVRLMQQEKAPVFCVFLSAVGIVNFALAYVPAAAGLHDAAIPFTTSVQRYPHVDTRFDAVQEIVDDLQQNIGEKSSLVYVVGSNEYLSSELLKRINLPEQIDSAPFVMYSSISDRRDGFPSNLFMADYVLLLDPFVPSYESVQQVSYQVYDMLVNDPEVSPYYQLEESYPVDGSDVLVFKKALAADTSLVNNLSDRLEGYYPNEPHVYQPQYIIALFEYDRLLNVDFDYWARNFTFRHDGSKAIEMGWRDTSALSVLQFQMQTKTTAMELVVQNQDGDLLRAELKQDAWQDFELDVAGSEYITIIATPLEQAEQGEEMEFVIDFNGKALR